MKTICHRGNMFGPNPEKENEPSYIQEALKSGYDVEVDVWLKDGELYLGHDGPTYKTSRYLLQNKRVWVHCKDVTTYLELSKFSNINCFFQNNDDIVKTSQGYFWAHSKCQSFNDQTVVTDLEAKTWNQPKPYAICSDYIVEGTTINTLPFNLLIIDIDGVMTNGTKTYDREARVVGKNYCDLDFTAIKRFKAAGIKVCFLSGDKTINEAMALSRKIDFFHNTPGTDKIDYLYDLKLRYGAVKVAYVGDDYYDLAIMNFVDLAFCPNTSPNIVKKVAQVINVPAGHGVIAGLYDLFEDKIEYAFPIDSADVNPK